MSEIHIPLTIENYSMTQIQYEDHRWLMLNYGVEEFEDFTQLSTHGYILSSNDLDMIKNKGKTEHLQLKDGVLCLVKYHIYENYFNLSKHMMWNKEPLHCPTACTALDKWRSGSKY